MSDVYFNTPTHSQNDVAEYVPGVPTIYLISSARSQNYVAEYVPGMSAIYFITPTISCLVCLPFISSHPQSHQTDLRSELCCRICARSAYYISHHTHPHKTGAESRPGATQLHTPAHLQHSLDCYRGFGLQNSPCDQLSEHVRAELHPPQCEDASRGTV